MVDLGMAFMGDCVFDEVKEKDESKNQVVGTSSETTSGDDNLSVPC